jgi:ribosome-associated heat shock protein Hsp15
MVRASGGWFSEQIKLDRNNRRPADSLGERCSATPARQRLDRWLWHARLVRTRGAAAALADAGYVRINGTRVDAPGRQVRTGDVITVALDRRVRVLKVRAFAKRRGPATVAATLYEELT